MNTKKIIPGTRIGELRVTPSKTQMFMFSAITWNRHQIHFNRDQAEAEGFSDVAVQRGLLGNFLSRLMTDWAGGSGRLIRLQWKVVKSAFPGEELTCQGEVTAVTDAGVAKQVDCAIRILNSAGELIATGEARVEFLSGLAYMRSTQAESPQP